MVPQVGRPQRAGDNHPAANLASAATGQGDKLEEPDHSSSDWYFTREIIDCDSPSRKDGIDLKKETYLRRSYCTFLQDLGMRLNVPQITIATAIVFCHRFFLRQSHHHNDRFMIGAVCMFLAAKVEETPRRLDEVVKIAADMQLKRERETVSPARRKGKEEEMKEQLLVGERLLLTTLGFDLNVSHPYKPLVAAIKKLGVAQQALAQVAWNFVNDGLRTSLCLQFKPHHIAAGAIFLAAKFLKVNLPMGGPSAWFHDFDVDVRQLEEVSNQVLELYEQNKSAAAAASRASAPSSTGGPTASKQRRATANGLPANAQALSKGPPLSTKGAALEVQEAVSSKSSVKDGPQLTWEAPQEGVQQPSSIPGGGSLEMGQQRPASSPRALSSPQVGPAEQASQQLRSKVSDRGEDGHGRTELEDDAMSLDSADGARGQESPFQVDEPPPVSREQASPSKEARPPLSPRRSSAASDMQQEAEAEAPAEPKAAVAEEDEEQQRTWDMLEEVEIRGGRAKERSGRLKLRKPVGDLLPSNVRESLAKRGWAEGGGAGAGPAEAPLPGPAVSGASAGDDGAQAAEGRGARSGDRRGPEGETEAGRPPSKKGSEEGEPAGKEEVGSDAAEEGELPVKRKRDTGATSDTSGGEGKRLRSDFEQGELDNRQASPEAGDAEPIEEGELPERSASPAYKEAERAQSGDRGGLAEGTSRRSSQPRVRTSLDGGGSSYGQDGRSGYRSRDGYSHSYMYSRDRERYREPYRDRSEKDYDRDRERHKGHREDTDDWPPRRSKFH